MPINIVTFDQDPNVQGFIKYLAAVIQGTEPVAHEYLDRYLNRLHPNNRNGLNPQRHFQTLEDAFHGYYWPDPAGSYTVNQQTLTALQADIRAAWNARNETGLRTAIDSILWWGAGNRRARLYTANMSWFDTHLANADAAMLMLQDAKNAFNAAPVFDENAFQGLTLRSNAGFTKVYALLFDNFIIYDSRVSAALGLLVTKYLGVQQPPVNRLCNNLNFARMNAAGGDNRDASIRELKFRFARTHAYHAQSNWMANRVLKNAVDYLFNENMAPGWIGEPSDALRRIEASLFMLGKHIPITDGVDPLASLTYDETLAEVEAGIDDDAGPRVLYTLSQKKPFLCDWDPLLQRMEFWFGRRNKNRVTVEEALLVECLEHFRPMDWFLVASAHVDCNQRKPSSLGRWLCETGNVDVNIASYFAAFLVDQDLAEYRRQGRSGGELRIRRS